MEESKDKKEEILKAGSACFARYGYEKTTMDDIGRLVGLNKASLYYYYKNKESIFSEVILKERAEYITRLQNSIKKRKNVRQKILSYMKDRYRFVLDYFNLQNLSKESINQLRPFFVLLYQSGIDNEINFIKSLIDQGVKSKKFKPCDSKRIAANIITIGDAIKQRESARAELDQKNGYDHKKI
jgi:AcrR family transcriptional regulator